MIVKKGPINKDIDKQAYSEGEKKSSLNLICHGNPKILNTSRIGSYALVVTGNVGFVGTGGIGINDV